MTLCPHFVDNGNEVAQGDEGTRGQDEQQDVAGLGQQGEAEDAASTQQFAADAEEGETKRKAQSDADAVEERCHGRLLGSESLGTSEDQIGRV